MIYDNGRELVDNPKNRRTVKLNQAVREIGERLHWMELARARRWTLHGLVGERLPEVVEQYLPGDLEEYTWQQIAEGLEKAVDDERNRA